MNKYEEHFDFKFITKDQIRKIVLFSLLLIAILLSFYIKEITTSKEFYFDWNWRPINKIEYEKFKEEHSRKTNNEFSQIISN